MLKEFLPQLQRVAVIWEPNSAAGRDSMRETEMAARALRIDVEGFGVNRVDDFSGVFQSIATGRFDALDVLAGPIVTDNRARILAFSSQARIPDLYQERPFVEAGGLLSYGPIALAVLRLINNSNLVGRSTGKSAGFAPFRIRST